MQQQLRNKASGQTSVYSANREEPAGACSSVPATAVVKSEIAIHEIPKVRITGTSFRAAIGWECRRS
jgi:hypothetical protein